MQGCLLVEWEQMVKPDVMAVFKEFDHVPHNEGFGGAGKFCNNQGNFHRA
jgi:hypothetical protein